MAPALTATGTLALVLLPLPSSPEPLLPQAAASPVARAGPAPTASIRMVSSPMSGGVSIRKMVWPEVRPCPRWPAGPLGKARRRARSRGWVGMVGLQVGCPVSAPVGTAPASPSFPGEANPKGWPSKQGEIRICWELMDLMWSGLSILSAGSKPKVSSGFNAPIAQGTADVNHPRLAR